MSRRRRLELLAASRSNGHAPPPEETAKGVAAAWAADEDALEEARTAAHDNLVALLGDRRRSGVEWHQWPPAEGIDVLDGMIAASGELIESTGGTAELVAYYRALREKLLVLGGFLVLAIADGAIS